MEQHSEYSKSRDPIIGVIQGFPKIRGTLFGGPYSKDYSIMGFILGSPILGNYLIGVIQGILHL